MSAAVESRISDEMLDAAAVAAYGSDWLRYSEGARRNDRDRLRRAIVAALDFEATA